MNAKENFDVSTYRSTEEVMLQSGDTVWGIAKRALQTANVPHDDQTINLLTQIILDLNKIGRDKASSLTSRKLQVPNFTNISTPVTFNDADIWLGRLENILMAIGETKQEAENQALTRGEVYKIYEQAHQKLIKMTKEELEKAEKKFEFKMASKLAISESLFMHSTEQDQFYSLHTLLSTMENFGRELLAEYTTRLLPPEWSENRPPPTHLLRAAYHQISTDLQLVQSALKQRLWAKKPIHQMTFPAKTSDFRAIMRDANQRYNTLTKEAIADHGRKGADYAANAVTAVETAILQMGTRSKQAQTLIYADIMAKSALEAADVLIEGGANNWQTNATLEVVSYFSEGMQVRILPYYPQVILIGVPFSSGFSEWEEESWKNRESIFDAETEKKPAGKKPQSTASKLAQIPWEYLSIPHEIGHYLFWNGDEFDADGRRIGSLDAKLRNTLNDSLGIGKADWRYHWLEELFSDVFGCLLMGPMAGLHLQVILSDAPEADWFLDNGHHPIPAVRPYINSLILQRLQHKFGINFSNAIAQLNTNWDGILKSWGFTDNLNAIHVGRGSTSHAKGQWSQHNHRDQVGGDEEPVEAQTLSYSQMEIQLIPVIDAILDTLQPATTKLQDDASGVFPWHADLAQGEGIDHLIGHLWDLLDSKLISEIAPFFPAQNNAETFAQAKQSIASINGDALAQHLEKTYLDNWGDKGPKGGGVGF